MAFFIFFCFIVVLGACQRSNVEMTPDYNADHRDNNIQNITPSLAGSNSHRTILTTIEPPDLIITAESLEPTENLAPTPQWELITPTSEPFAICSPLEGETIDMLSEIISDPYAPPPPGRDERHHGVDFAYYRRNGRLSIEGVKVQAILSGTISAVINDRLPYGNMVIIETPHDAFPSTIREQLGLVWGESVYHLYAHMQSNPQFLIGARVSCGDYLGLVGRTGYNIVEPHLHLETRIGPGGQVFSEMAYYDTRASQEEMDTYLRWRVSGEYQHFDPMLLFEVHQNQFFP